MLPEAISLWLLCKALSAPSFCLSFFQSVFRNKNSPRDQRPRGLNSSRLARAGLTEQIHTGVNDATLTGVISGRVHHRSGRNRSAVVGGGRRGAVAMTAVAVAAAIAHGSTAAGHASGFAAALLAAAEDQLQQRGPLLAALGLAARRLAAVIATASRFATARRSARGGAAGRFAHRAARSGAAGRFATARRSARSRAAGRLAHRTARSGAASRLTSRSRAAGRLASRRRAASGLATRRGATAVAAAAQTEHLVQQGGAKARRTQAHGEHERGDRSIALH